MKILADKTSRLTPGELFTGLARLKGAIWLDSSLTTDDWGGLSIIAANPVAELTLVDNQTVIRTADGTIRQGDRNMFFAELDRIATGPDNHAVGHITYEATLPWLGLDYKKTPSVVPQAHFFVYDKLLKYDHHNGEFDNPELAIRYQEQNNVWHDLPETDMETGNPEISSLPKAVYLEKVKRIKWHIREGDIYQANLTCRFDVGSSLPPADVYRRLRELNPAPYSAFMNFGEYQVLSSSPERMFLREGSRIYSSPIKGTISRGANAAEENRNLSRLRNSAKDRAELLMIVDLVRNDLGRIAQTGSVRVENLFRSQIYSSLIHLMADISADLKTETQLSDIFATLLPGGSITGAPKKRAVEIINEMETSAHESVWKNHAGRSVYTGCIGYIENDRADFNIAIRTMIHDHGRYQVYAGGGIVADSDPLAEYDEMLLKARNMFRATGHDL